MDFLDVMLESILTEVTAEEKYTKQYTDKLDRAIFDKAVALDPTSKGAAKVGKYVDWIIRNKAYDDKDLPTMLAKFEKYKEKLDPARRDINKMKPTTLATFIDTAEDEGLLVSKTEKAAADKKKAEKESKIQYQDDQLIVITPETEFASRYFGKGADWCTARQEGAAGTCMFKNYNRRGDLYIVKNKKTGKRWQLFKTDGGESEYRDANDETFDPFVTFEDNSDFIEWLKKEEFPNSGELTDAQIEELASSLVSQLGIGNNRNTAHEYAMNAVRQEADNLRDADIGDVYSNLTDMVDRGVGEIEQALEYLEENYFVDPDDDQNKLNLIGQAFWGDLHYEVEHDPDRYIGKNSHYTWVYKFNETAEDIAERIRDFDEVIDYLPAWLEHAYEHKEKEFFDFFDDFTAAMKSEKQALTKEEEEALKEMIDKAEKKGYKKAGHPELKLDSVNRYLDKVLS